MVLGMRIRESLDESRRAFWHLRHEGFAGVKRFRERERSNVEHTATLDELLSSLPTSAIKAEVGPLRERVGGCFLARSGLGVFAEKSSQSTIVRQARAIADQLGMRDAPLDVYVVEDDGRITGDRGVLTPSILALTLKGYEGVVLGSETILRAALAECGTPILSTQQPLPNGRDSLERLGYIQRVKSCVSNVQGSVSAVVATNRPAQLEHVITILASQTRIPDEILIGTHGFSASESTRTFGSSAGLDIRWIEMDADMRVGGIFCNLISESSGEWIAKMDDDDLYGCEYIADALWMAERTGADLVGKNANYVYFSERDETVLRFPGRELIETYLVAGPTLFTRRETALEIGYPDLARSDDTEYVRAVQAGGGRIVASSRFGFAYMRHGGSHVWAESSNEIVEKAIPVHGGLPGTIELPFGYGSKLDEE